MKISTSVADSQVQHIVMPTRVNRNCARTDTCRYAVLDRILYQRLEDHRGYGCSQDVRCHFMSCAEAIAKADLLHRQITADKLQLLLQRNILRPRIVKSEPQEIAKPFKHVDDRLSFAFQGQHRYRIKSVEEKVRVQLTSQCLKACLG